MIEIELKSIVQNNINPLQFDITLSEVKGEKEFSFSVNQAKGRVLMMSLDSKNRHTGLHHLYVHTLQKINMQIHKINIINYENNEFESQLILRKEDFSLLPVSCNIYDAIIFSIFTFCPIYIEENIFYLLIEEQKQYSNNQHVEYFRTLPQEAIAYQQIQTPYLEKMLSLAIQKEEYEKAIYIKNELQKRKEKNE